MASALDIMFEARAKPLSHNARSALMELALQMRGTERTAMSREVFGWLVGIGFSDRTARRTLTELRRHGILEVKLGRDTATYWLCQGRPTVAYRVSKDEIRSRRPSRSDQEQQHPGEDMGNETDQLLLASLAARQFEWEPEDQFDARERVMKSLERFLRYNPEWTTEALAAWWDHAIEKLNLRIRAWNVILGPRWAEARDAFLAEWSNPRPQYRDLSARKAAK